MKKKRTVTIKNPFLIRIRTFLRKIIILESIRRYKLLEEAGNWEEYKLAKDKLHASICMCDVCWRSNQDMTFNSQLGIWYCTECFENISNFSVELFDRLRRGEPVGDFRGTEEFYKTFL